METDLFKLVGIVIVSFYIIYLVIGIFKAQSDLLEGFTGDSAIDSKKATTTSTSSSATSGSLGIAGSAQSYAEEVKANYVKLQDELLVPKYRKEYENIIINMDDYLNAKMMEQILSIKMGSNSETESFKILSTLYSAKSALNDAMKWVDKN
jgi:hypothetical protein